MKNDKCGDESPFYSYTKYLTKKKGHSYTKYVRGQKKYIDIFSSRKVIISIKSRQTAAQDLEIHRAEYIRIG